MIIFRDKSWIGAWIVIGILAGFIIGTVTKIKFGGFLDLSFAALFAALIYNEVKTLGGLIIMMFMVLCADFMLFLKMQIQNVQEKFQPPK